MEHILGKPLLLAFGGEAYRVLRESAKLSFDGPGLLGKVDSHTWDVVGLGLAEEPSALRQHPGIRKQLLEIVLWSKEGWHDAAQIHVAGVYVPNEIASQIAWLRAVEINRSKV